MTTVTVVAGCYSLPFEIKLETPTSDPLTLVPNGSDSTIAFDPAELFYQYAWLYTQNLRIKAPSNLAAGTYTVSYTKQSNTNSSQDFSVPADTKVIVEAPSDSNR